MKYSFRFPIRCFTKQMLTTLVCLALLTSLQCKKEDATQEELILVALDLLETPGDYFAKLYRVDPLIAASPKNTNLIWEAQAGTSDASKPKLVLVHGWHFTDRDSMNNLSLNDLKKRVLDENWSAFFGTAEFAIILNTDYEVYAFDYLTSNGVDINGQRFRDDLDNVFGGDSNNVLIYAHSMGGLVTRFAMYEGSRPSYMKRVVSSGTPYHGSPFASPEFQTSLPVLLEGLAGFLTGTDGGRDMAWDNYNPDLTIGAGNPKLSDLNSKTDRDDLFFPMYGTCNSTACTGPEATHTLDLACGLLGDIYSPSDCVVPSVSAKLDGHTTHSERNIGAFDHLDIKMGTAIIRSTFIDVLLQTQ